VTGTTPEFIPLNTCANSANAQSVKTHLHGIQNLGENKKVPFKDIEKILPKVPGRSPWHLSI